MELFLIRHGKTTFGTEDRFEGVSDSPLSQAGLIQSEILGEYLKNKNVSSIYSSPLPRAQQTAEIIKKHIGDKIKITTDERLREISYGDWDGKKKSELRCLPEWLEREKQKYYWQNPGICDGVIGESYAMLESKIVPTQMEFLNKKISKNIILVTHNGVLRVIRKHIEKLEPSTAINTPWPHENIFKIYKDGANQIHSEIINTRL
jgi:probable phosphoglycerate mutase